MVLEMRILVFSASAWGRLDWEQPYGYLSSYDEANVLYLIELVCTFDRIYRILYLTSVCINYILVKIGIYTLVTLNFHILLSFLSNFIEKFEPAEQDWNSSIKNGMGANHGISSPPSLSIHVRDAVYLTPCTCSAEGCSQIHHNFCHIVTYHQFPCLNYRSVSSL